MRKQNSMHKKKSKKFLVNYVMKEMLEKTYKMNWQKEIRKLNN